MVGIVYYALVRFAEKTSQNIVLTDLLGEKNTVQAKKNKLKSTDYKTSEQGIYCPSFIFPSIQIIIFIYVTIDYNVVFTGH